MNNRTIKFSTSGGNTYTFLPLSDNRIVAISYIYSLLGISMARAKNSLPLEFLQVANKKRKECLTLIALCIATEITENILERIVKTLREELDWSDTAALLICILIYYSDDFRKYVLRKEEKRTWQA